MKWRLNKSIGWQESKKVNKKDMYKSYYTISFSGMHVSFEICCVYLRGEWKWMLNCEKFGVHANYLGKAEEISKEQVRYKSLRIVKGIISDHLQEVELQMQDVDK